MTTKGVIAPKVETLSSPDRLVVNLPNTLLATSAGRISVGNAGVKGLRMGMDASGTTRVVVDMERPSKFELVPGQKLILKIADDARTTHAAAVPMKVTAPVVRRKGGACSGNGGSRENLGAGPCHCHADLRCQERKC